MNVMTPWKTQLEQILELPIDTRTLAGSDWREDLETADQRDTQPQPGQQFTLKDGSVRFVVRADVRQVEFFDVEKGALTDKERRFVAWMLEQLKPGAQHAQSTGSEAERKHRALGEWMQAQLEEGKTKVIIPEEHNQGGRLYQEMVPFLLVSEQEAKRTGSGYRELEKLLKSFFEEEVVLIPLQDKEWLILGPGSLVHDERDGRGDDEEESVEEQLTGICLGLHDMLASEWIGECHVAVGLPIRPNESAVETTSVLRETIMLGRKFHSGGNIHLPWMIHLERLLGSIPEAQRIHYMEQMMSRSDVLFEPEIVGTLETYFNMNCNVSDTAKKLFIHRNTLLYRLDKLKQDTGLDVRLFRDAVLVKLILLLYKVTKRK
ncbi:hypothetical protein BG53_03000 [Paenibacillus darwinianus]|uniref:PucR C-terminal helix-turn-helix domain-containing protein n=1 Tax=Paenibacillus darwinianus TaxID=1380763 RepID=A0A9W5W7E5_9BACL|nr:helix-turn-helix domain-containing protein [Paenibacillus darwinianus]EXX87881.1 hypothetical protein BG53_03000 [Paenibacillus darwinianus]EXX88178.1 hypothetical protein BG52_02550 [Paenibacillus darwinianus]EXX88457.1 hypothetical protein CH50_03370 [Paenibacillus darwinianus]